MAVSAVAYQMPMCMVGSSWDIKIKAVEKWWRSGGEMMGEVGEERGGDRLAVRTTIFYVRVSRTDHLPPPRKICFATRTWVGYDVRELLLGKKNTHLCGGGVKESTQQQPS